MGQDKSKTPLDIAKERDFERIADLLTEAGAEATTRDTKGLSGQGKTALDVARERGCSEELVNMLTDAGADANLRDTKGFAPDETGQSAKTKPGGSQGPSR